MKVLIVLEYYHPHTGGVERLFETIAIGLVRAGHEVRVITTHLPGYKKREERHGVSIERIRVPFNSRSLFSLWATPAVARAATWADVIHTSTYTAIPPSSFAGVVTKTPVLITGHERIGRRWFALPRVNPIRALALYLSEHVLYRFPKALIAAVSEASKHDIVAAGIRAEKVIRVYNAIDPEPWHEHEQNEDLIETYGLRGRTVFVVYGRPGVSKGIEYAVRAFPSIKKRVSNATLLIVLSKRPEDGYAAVSRELDRIGREDVIEKNDLLFNDLVEHVNLADVVIIPSLTEGFGFTTYESCLLGKRVVASNAGSIPEVIFGRYALVKPADPEAIAHGCERVLKDEKRTEKKAFSEDAMIQGYLDAYERITQKRRT